MKNLLLLVLLLTTSAIAQKAGRTSTVLDEIELKGVSAFSQSEIEDNLSFFPGDRPTVEDLERTKANLITLYRRKGYQKISIQIRKIKRGKKIQINVKEGLPVRVASSSADVADIRGPYFGKAWNAVRKKLASEISLKPGDLLDQDKIADVSRTLENILTSENLVGAKLRDVETTSVRRPNKPDQIAKLSADRWVAVKFKIDLGDRVSFGFRGNKRFNRIELLDLVEDQKFIGLGKDYVSAIAEAVRDKYRSIGYYHVKVDYRTYENLKLNERHVTYLINEGPRVAIDSIDFDGNLYFSSDDLREQFFERASLLVERKIYVEKDVESAAEAILDYIKSNGYLSAKLIIINRNFIEEGTAVRLLIYLYEGEQTFLRTVNLEGVKVFKKSEILKIIGLKEKGALNLFGFSEGLEKLKKAYRDRGYLDFRIVNENQENVVRYFQKNRFAEIALKLSEGPQFRASKIYIEGTKRTRPYVVLRELTFKEGDILEQQKLIETEQNLRRVGIFSRVSIQLRDDPQRKGFKQVKLSLKESSRIRVAVGLGIRNDRGVRAFAETAYTNLFEVNHTWSLTGSVNRRLEAFETTEGDPSTTQPTFLEGELSMRYRWPYFLLDRLTFRPQITIERRDFRLFDADSLSLRATFERTVWRKVNLVAALTYSLEQIEQFNATFAEDNDTLQIGAITPSLRLDLRDNPLAPSKGLFSSASFELAYPFLASQSEPVPISYYRFVWRTDGFVPLGNRVTWFLSFRMGFEKNLVDPEPYRCDPSDSSCDQSLFGKVGIPLSKQFALGGAGSLRGYKIQELNVLDTDLNGTLAYVNYRTQIDFPLSGSMRIGPFFDAGALHVDTIWFLRGLSTSFGVGLHYETPVGPVNFDWGFKIDPVPGTDTNRFHFTIGIL